MTQLYQITPGLAQARQLPQWFVATQIAESNKAVYVYGHGTTDTKRMGFCCVCGRTLTHPVSVELGIGPECGRHYWDWERVGGYTKENVARLTERIRQDIIIDCWLPKSQIVQTTDTVDVVNLPAEHPILKRIPTTTNNKPVRSASLAETVKGNKIIKVIFPFNNEDLAFIRSVADRKWNAEQKFWTVPLTVEAVEQLRDKKFELCEELNTFLSTARLNVSQVTNTLEIPGLKGTLYPFQRQGVAFIEARHGRALIADEMGLGKTIQALAWLQLHPELYTIIVVPATVKINWAREAERWLTNPTVAILSGTDPDKWILPVKEAPHIIIINYDILPYWLERLQTMPVQALIIDEIQKIKNNKAKRTKAVKILGKNKPHVIGLSGTPLVNRPIELYNAGKLINPTVFPSLWEYGKRFCGAYMDRYGWNFEGATNKEELHELLTNTIMLRRLKKDVLTELPEKTRTFLPLELNNWQEYAAAEDDFIQFIKDTRGIDAARRASNAEQLTQIEVLKQVAVHGKLPQAIEWVNDFLETDKKLGVFAVHKFVIDALMEAFPKIAVKIDGSVSMEHRQRAVDEFQNNPNVRLFVGNIQAAGVGITLTAASDVAFLELPWTPGELVQAEDRFHRIGQRHNVQINYLLAVNTIEEKIARMLDRKRQVLDAVLDGKETDQESLLSELIKSYVEPNT